MSHLEGIIALILMVLFVGLGAYHYLLGDKLFKLLANKFSAYYSNIGEPMYFSDLVSNWRAQNYLMDLTIKGIPKTMPADKAVRKLATRTRKIAIIALVYLGILCVVWTML